MTEIQPIVQYVGETVSTHNRSKHSLFLRRQCSSKVSSCGLLSVLLAVACLFLPAQEAISSSGAQARADALAMSPLAVEFEGELEAIYEDYADGGHKLQYYLKANGKRHKIEFEQPPAHIVPGTPVRLSAFEQMPDTARVPGMESETTLVASGDEAIMYLSSGSSDGSPQPVQGGVVGTPFHTTGAQPTVVLLVNFQDTASSTPFTLSQARDAIFGTVSDYLMEASYGQTWLSGDVYGWLTLPMDSICNTDDIGNAADQAAMDAGIDLSSYGRFIYVFDGTASCNWIGAANLWVYPSRAWIKRNISPYVIAHELGHNLGLSHSYMLDCGDAVLGNDCISSKDDKFDVMGSAVEPGHYNAVQKDRMGWFRAGEVETVTASGTFFMSPYELSGAPYPRVLKFPRQVDPLSGRTDWYYLEYRQPLGFDSFIAGNSNVENGILVHTGTDDDIDAPLLLDMTPESSMFETQDREDPGLVVGASFTDPLAGISIATDLADGAVAAVTINLGADSCVRQTPQVSLSPSSQSTEAGFSVKYVLSLTNQDAASCAGSTFDLSYTIPSGWTGSLSPGSLNLMPGETGSASLVVTSSAGAAVGSYGVSMVLNDTGEAGHASSVNASYEVVDACVAAMPGLTLSPASQDGAAGSTQVYTASLTNNDSASCSPSSFDLSIISLPVGWSGTLSDQLMSIDPGASGTFNLTVSSADDAQAASYTLQVGISDATEPAHAKVATASYRVIDTTTTSDTEPPTIPSGLAASATNRQVNLSWSPSSDNTGVAGYGIYRDGIRIATTVDAAYSDTAGQDGVVYEYRVDARDAAGNVSPKSNPVMAGKGKSKGGGGSGGKGKGANN